MMHNARFATWVVSGYLVVYCILLGLGSGFWRAVAVGMFFCSPILVIWMAYCIIRYGGRDVPELEEGAEFGYGDRCLQ
ncbi:MAG TPA: hypothetical protein VHE34_03035 [Puia sp.]|uniref:hypothetical protein n=1 Tax=Puia sp. TaxID=2045100 RepID=UPI002CFCB551|nr:hypothetical protein [Puia sp.]HVU94165.1 hypothetical protein [Puia sp.]